MMKFLGSSMLLIVMKVPRFNILYEVENMKKYAILDFPQLGDQRGNLVVIEGINQIPFEIARVFYMYGTKGDVIRGQHANRRSQFVLINVCGECKIKVDDGLNKDIVVLNRPHMGIYLDKMVWKDMYDFSPDSILLVLASEKYDSSEYIRDIEAFYKERQIT